MFRTILKVLFPRSIISLSSVAKVLSLLLSHLFYYMDLCCFYYRLPLYLLFPSSARIAKLAEIPVSEKSNLRNDISVGVVSRHLARMRLDEVFCTMYALPLIVSPILVLKASRKQSSVFSSFTLSSRHIMESCTKAQIVSPTCLLVQVALVNRYV